MANKHDNGAKVDSFATSHCISKALKRSRVPVKLARVLVGSSRDSWLATDMHDISSKLQQNAACCWYYQVSGITRYLAKNITRQSAASILICAWMLGTTSGKSSNCVAPHHDILVWCQCLSRQCKLTVVKSILAFASEGAGGAEAGSAF